MVGVLQKYRYLLLILSLMLLFAVIWFIFFREDAGEISSRGVFVLNADTYCAIGRV